MMRKGEITSRSPPSLAPDESWWRGGGGGWATAAVVLLLLSWHLLRALLRRRRRRPAWSPAANPVSNPSLGSSKMVSDDELKELMIRLEGKLDEGERWDEVVNKKNDQVSYWAKCCRPKVGPLKYLSVTVFENCSTELLRDFYMDNEYRKEWDKTLVLHEQIQVDERNGTEIGRTIKKFPLLTPREYVLVWRVWEGKDKTFYCFIKDCEHSRAPRQKKYVRVGFFRSGWRIRKVPGRDACEITMVHQEDAGLNIEMAKLAFAKGIWNYVCKMNSAVQEYSPRIRLHSNSVATMLRLIQKVPPQLEHDNEKGSQGPSEISGDGAVERGLISGKKLLRRPSSKWIANGLLLLGGVVCLSRGRSTIGTQIAMACLMKKLMKQDNASEHPDPAHAVAGVKRQTRRNN